MIKKLLVTLLSFEVHNEITASPWACVSYFTTNHTGRIYRDPEHFILLHGTSCSTGDFINRKLCLPLFIDIAEVIFLNNRNNLCFK